MPEWIESLNEHGRQEWYKLLQSMGMAYHAKDKRKVIEVSGQLEDIESIAKIMAQAPGKDKSNELI